MLPFAVATRGATIPGTVAKPFYAREISNLKLAIAPFQLIPGVHLLPVPSELSREIDRRVSRLGFRYPDVGVLIEQEPGGSPDQWPNGEPDWATVIVPGALLLSVDRRLCFGPRFQVTLPDSRLDPVLDLPVIHYDRLYSGGLPPASARVIKLESADVPVLRTTVEQLAAHWISVRNAAGKEPLAAAYNRFIRACLDDRDDDALIDLSIALEGLYLDGDSDKGRLIARRGATFVGPDPATRAVEYRQLRAFYKARNAILHDGVRSPAVSAQGQTFDLPQLVAAGFDHVRAAIRKILGIPPPPLPKTTFIARVKASETSLASELDGLDNAIGSMSVIDT